MKTILSILAVLALSMNAHAEHEHEHDHDKHDGELHVSAAAQKLMGLTTVKAEKRNVAATMSLFGRFELPEDARIAAVSPVAGKISLKVRPLQRVRKGEILFSVVSPDVRARQAELAIIEKRLASYRTLGRKNAELESQAAVKRAELETMTGGAATNGVVDVIASVDAIVEAPALADGAWADVGATVVSMLQTNRLRLRTQVAAGDANLLKDGMSAEVDGVTGKIRFALTNETSVQTLFVEFDRLAETWRPGMRGKAICVTDASTAKLVAVPEECLITVGLDPVVIVKDDDEEDAFLPVKVSPTVRGGGYVAVDGLPENSEVVKNGVYELKLALGGTAKKAGHFHADGQFHEGEH